MAKKKKVATITEYPQHENMKGLRPLFVNQIFGQYAFNGIARFLIAKRETAPELGSQFIEISGKIAVPLSSFQIITSGNFEVMEAEIIIIPRRKIQSHKDKLGRMTREMILNSDLLAKMENSYLIRADEDTTEYEREKVEIIKL